MSSYTANDNMSISSAELRETKKQLKYLQQSLDTRVFVMSKTFRNVSINGKYYKKYVEKYNVYGSGSQGTRIRNAITGMKQSQLVGSADEDLYFKVISTVVPGAVGSVTLFYSSPSEYEMHQNAIVSDSVKEAWRQKKQQLTQLTN